MKTALIERRTTADGFDTLFDAGYGQTYHSSHGALVEADHVFLTGTGVKQRLNRGQPARVLEIGFGTGLNFWLTVHRRNDENSPLHYVALEKTLLPGPVLAQLNHGQLSLVIAKLRSEFVAWRDGLDPGVSAACWSGRQNIRLDLLLGDAACASIPNHQYHAIYLDAFSPDVNPELWTEPFFARLFPLLEPAGRLATYSVKGSVRRGLQAAGFSVHKEPGPPGKKEVLVAIKPD